MGKAAFDRRDFLKAGTGLVLGIALPGGLIAHAASAAPTVFEPNVYLKIGSDGSIVIYAKNPEIGQGVKTSMPQIVAEELEVDWQQVEVRQGLLDNRFGAQFAGGSTAIKDNYEALRRAGAAAREMLIEAAARKWNVSLDQCYAEHGCVLRRDTGAKLRYAELAATASTLSVRENPVLKDRKDFKLIGQAIGGVDARAIVTGRAEYGLDARPKDALVAMIERCPVFGAGIKRIDDAAALKVPGVLRVLRIDASADPTRLVSGVAVIATSTWAAMQGRKALIVDWDSDGKDGESDAQLHAQFARNIRAKGTVLRDDGDVDAAFKLCKILHTADYEAPFLAHATMEPMNYIADVRADGAELWGPTQVPGSVRAMAAQITGLPASKITVRMTRIGGGFGRRLMADYACEAITLSKALGKPVQVVWTREDDIRHDFYRPAGMHRLTAGLDEQGRLLAWHTASSTTSRGAFSGSTNPPHKTEVFPDAFPAGLIAHCRVEYTPVASPVPRGAWRGPGHNVTAWSDECFLDELAALAKRDAVTFRLGLLGESDRQMPFGDHGGPFYSTARLARVIRLAAEKSGWHGPAQPGVFRGFASHFMFGAYIAEVVSVRMTGATSFKVESVVAAVDCGVVINRSGALAQLQGGINDGLSAALHQAIHIEKGRVKEGNFNDYPLLRMDAAPVIDIHFVDSAANPEGLGEIALPPLAAALCNALHAATGKRVRKLPIDLGAASTADTRVPVLTIRIDKDDHLHVGGRRIAHIDALFASLHTESAKHPRPTVHLDAVMTDNYQLVGKVIYTIQRADLGDMSIETDKGIVRPGV